MFDKNFLVGKVVNSLERVGYEVLQTAGSFDIAARMGEKVLLVKVLMNVDALKEDQAMSLRAVAYFMNGQALVVCVKNNRETLEDDVVYSRFELPVMTPKLLESMVVQNEISAASSAKGRRTVEIDPEAMRGRRKELGLTLEGLAERAGITKKAAYEIESRRVNPTRETAEKLERILSAKIQKPYQIREAPITYLKPRSEEQGRLSKELSRIGIDNSSVYSSQFHNVGKERFPIITSLSHSVDRIKHKAIELRKISGFFSSKAVFVAKKSDKGSVHGVAVVLESELPEIGSSKDLKKFIEEKE